MKSIYVPKKFDEGYPSLLARSFHAHLLCLLKLRLMMDQPYQLEMSRRRNDDYELHSHTKQPW